MIGFGGKRGKPEFSTLRLLLNQHRGLGLTGLLAGLLVVVGLASSSCKDDDPLVFCGTVPDSLAGMPEDTFFVNQDSFLLPYFLDADGDTLSILYSTAFTPNGDTLNQQFELFMEGFATTEAYITDGSSRRVNFAENTDSLYWDGSLRGRVRDGSFFLRVNFTYLEGEGSENPTVREGFLESTVCVFTQKPIPCIDALPNLRFPDQVDPLRGYKITTAELCADQVADTLDQVQ